MTVYRFEEIAHNINDKKMPVPGDEKTYIGLEHLDTGSLQVTRWGQDVVLTGEKLVMKKGDVLFGRRNTYLRRAAIAPHDGIFSAHGMIFRPKTDVIDAEFFPFFISSDYFIDEAIKISVGSLSPTVNWGTLKKLEFDLPSMEEQKRLAKILMAAEETRQAYKKLIKQTDDLIKAKFEEMFGKETCKKSLHDICNCFCDGDWIESKDQSDTGIRLIQTGNVGEGYYINKDSGKARYITEETFNKLHCTEVKTGDILVSRLPDPVGRACIVPEYVGKAITAVDCAIIRLKTILLPEFFIAFTLSTDYNQQINSFITGSTRKRISRNNLGSIQIPVPSIEKQQEFVDFLQQAEQTKLATQQSLEALNETVRALVNRNFN